MAKARERIEWVDRAKGLTILLVVLLHSTLGVEKYYAAQGWMHEVIAFAQPLRMPVFFAIAGLFAVKALSQNWRHFWDSKFVHFFYFYILWLCINFLFKGANFAADLGVDGAVLLFLKSFIHPFGLLWFIYLLPFFFLILRLTHRLPVFGQLLVAIGLKFVAEDLSFFVANRFADYYIFFLLGYFGREFWFRLAQSAQDQKLSVYFGLIIWALVNAAMVTMGYHADMPMALILGLTGIVAIVSFCAVLPNWGPGAALKYCGQNSLPIYLGFFLPMVISRILMPKLCEVCDSGLASLIVFLVAVLGAIAMFELVKRTKIGTFLYKRPHWAKLEPRRSNQIAPAE
ncbi:MAG: acyltransferase family protein [Cohaesibacter sp.]|nr:acyltransferase family protein [Cohaesibacter sp.]